MSAVTPTLDWRTRVATRAGSVLLKALAATWRMEVRGKEALLARHARGERAIILLWHGQMLAGTVAHRLPTRVLISEHRDGEIIARVVAHFGLGAVRGSSSRGGARALLEAAAVLKGGTDVAITPDGPRGPYRTFAAGALALAHRTGVPLVAIVTHADRAWRLRSWDRFEIPKPFARVVVEYLPPRFVQAADVREASAQAEETGAWMRRAQEALAEGAGDAAAPPAGSRER